MGQNLDLRESKSAPLKDANLHSAGIWETIKKKQVKWTIYVFLHTVKYPLFPIYNIKGNVEAPILKEKGRSRKDPACFQP